MGSAPSILWRNSPFSIVKLKYAPPPIGIVRQTLDNSEIEIQELHVNAPHLLKFKLPAKILSSGLFLYTNSSQETDSLLARLLFEVWGVEKVILTPETVTVAINGIEKALVLGPIKEAIKEHLFSGRPAIDNPMEYSFSKATGLEQKSKEKEIMKAVASINHDLFEQGRKIHLKGVKKNKVFVMIEGEVDTTLVYLVEFKIHELAPWVEEVVDVTENEKA